ncbi:diphosphomevalonate decarboxylase [Serratia quinivorans]|uniref:diphosphomevalonate decarboxylase n=1 Tax=Serratia quinivorans TaxID=137545 RepID=UPI003F9BBCA2
MVKVSAISAANIAFIKYWGIQDETAVLPNNVSLSMTLSQCLSHCTLEGLEEGQPDEVWWQTPAGTLQPATAAFSLGVRRHLQRLRAECGGGRPVRVATSNNFPTGAGIASSASGFSALALAASHMWQAAPDAARLSVLARLSGSGSAARSAFGGYVTWPGDAQRPDSAACQLAPAEYWPLYDVIAIVDDEHKAVSSREGHRRAPGSPYYQQRQQQLPQRLDQTTEAILARDFNALTDAVETEAIDLHVIAMTSSPAIFYWQPATLAVLAAVRQLRLDGVPACATIDAGPNVHVICPEGSHSQVQEVIERVPGVRRVIVDCTGNGPSLTERHLL